MNRQIKVIDAEENTAKLFYNTAGQEIRTIDPLGNSIISKYDRVGNRKKVSSGEQTISYYYTDQYFLEDEIVNEGKESERKTHYTYDKVGNVLTVTDPRGR